MELTDPALFAAVQKARGLSNVALAAEARCGESFIRALKSGRRDSCTPELAIRLCLALDLPDTSLLFAARVSNAGATPASARITQKAA